jgi:hypothetical protein
MALRNIDDLFEMLPASASIQGPLSIGFPHKSFRSTFKIYERELVIACPILLLFAHHCGSSAERSPTVRLLASRKLSILTQACASQKSGVRPTGRPRQLSRHAKSAGCSSERIRVVHPALLRSADIEHFCDLTTILVCSTVIQTT